MEKIEELLLKMRQIYQNENRIPKKSDFTAAEVNLIKGVYGPWRYALDDAGILPSKKEERLKKNREKRERSELRRAEGKCERK